MSLLATVREPVRRIVARCDGGVGFELGAQWAVVRNPVAAERIAHASPNVKLFERIPHAFLPDSHNATSLDQGSDVLSSCDKISMTAPIVEPETETRSRRSAKLRTLSASHHRADYKIQSGCEIPALQEYLRANPRHRSTEKVMMRVNEARLLFQSTRNHPDESALSARDHTLLEGVVGPPVAVVIKRISPNLITECSPYTTARTDSVHLQSTLSERHHLIP